MACTQRTTNGLGCRGGRIALVVTSAAFAVVMGLFAALVVAQRPSTAAPVDSPV